MAVTTAMQKLIDAQILMEQKRLLIGGVRDDEQSFNAPALTTLSDTEFKDIQESLSDAGLYVPDDHKYFRDGSFGGMTEHAMRLAGNPDYARDYINQTALTDDHLTNREIMFLQTSLNRMGYAGDKPLTVDGQWGRQTTQALTEFLKDNPEQIAHIAPSLKSRMSRYMDAEAKQVFDQREVPLPRTRPDHLATPVAAAVEAPVTPAQLPPLPESTLDAETANIPLPRVRPEHEPAVAEATEQRTFEINLENGVISEGGVPVYTPPSSETLVAPVPMPASMRPPSVEPVDPRETIAGYVAKNNGANVELGDMLPPVLHPGLVVLMERDPGVIPNVSLAMVSADEAGIDPLKYANQLYLESTYDINARSSRGAHGIAQFTVSTGAEYGLDTLADLRDPQKAIPAGANHMADMSEEFGSYENALVAYNAGKGGYEESFSFVTKMTGLQNPSMEQWISYNLTRQDQENNKGSAPFAWHNGTVDYVLDTNPSRWTEEKWNNILRELGSDAVMPADIAARFDAQDQEPFPTPRSEYIVAMQNGEPYDKPPTLAQLSQSEINVDSLVQRTLQQGHAEMEMSNKSWLNSTFRVAYDQPLMSTPQIQSFMPDKQNPEISPRVMQSKAVLDFGMPN